MKETISFIRFLHTIQIYLLREH